MARIPEEEIAKLKASVSLKRLVEARGVELRRIGSDWVGRCCFHEEAEGSLHVTEGSPDLWNCFGCNAGGGDVFTWVQKVEGVSFRQAYELLRAGYPDTVAPSSSALAKKSTTLKLPALAEQDATDRELMHQVVRFYHENLLASPAALEYLRRRGIGSQEAIERHLIGFSDRTLGYRLPASNRAAGAALRSRLQELGVYAPSGHERFRGCITVPLYDETGAVVQLYGRRISNKVARNERHLVLPAPIRGIFNRDAFVASREMILCEGITDALSFYCAGWRNVTACLGAGNLTEEMVRCFETHGTERVYIAFDPDRAGNQGAEEAARRLGGKGIECLRVEFPGALDACELALQHPPADKSLGQLLQLARRMSTGQRALAAEANQGPDRIGAAPAVSEPAGGTSPCEADEPVLESAVSDPADPQRTAAPAARKGTVGEASALEDAVYTPGTEPAQGQSQSIPTEMEGRQPGTPHMPEVVYTPDIEGSNAQRQRTKAREAAEPVTLEETVYSPNPEGPGAEDLLQAARQRTALAVERAPGAETHPAQSQSAPTIKRSAAFGTPSAEEPVYTPGAEPAHGVPSLAARAAQPRAAAAAPGSGPPPALELEGEQVLLELGDGRYRVLGLGKNTSLEQLRVNVRLERGQEWHQDNVDLYSAQRRRSFIKQAALEVGLPEEAIKRDIGKLLRGLEELHEQRMRATLAPKRAEVRLSEAERNEALELLRDGRLVERIAEDLGRTGLVGERTGKLVGYFACVSRLLPRPLGVLLQSSSAAGKSSLMEAVLAFMPPEQIQKYSALTGQALYYLGEGDLAHKILAIAEEGGSQRAAYSLKLLLSEGKLSIAAPGKDPESGKLITHEYHSDGPTMVFTSTTAAQLDEELQNRCMVLGVDESREQTRAIHEQQRWSRSLEGLWAKEERARLVKLHQNAQRLLEPVEVVNPYERHLTFLDDRTRTRRDHLQGPDLDRRDNARAPAPKAGPPLGALRAGEAVHRGRALRHRACDSAVARGARPVAGRAIAPDAAVLVAARSDGRERVRAARHREAAVALQPARGATAHRVERLCRQDAPTQARGAGVRARAPLRARPELRVRAALPRRRHGRGAIRARAHRRREAPPRARRALLRCEPGASGAGAGAR